MSKAKARGTAFETLIVGYLQQFFPHVERRTTQGGKDRGDIAGLPDVIEVKNCKAMVLSQWMHEAAIEADNAHVVGYCVVHKRKGVGDPAEQYVTMPLWHYVEFISGSIDKGERHWKSSS